MAAALTLGTALDSTTGGAVDLHQQGLISIDHRRSGSVQTLSTPCPGGWRHPARTLPRPRRGRWGSPPPAARSLPACDSPWPGRRSPGGTGGCTSGSADLQQSRTPPCRCGWCSGASRRQIRGHLVLPGRELRGHVKRGRSPSPRKKTWCAHRLSFLAPLLGLGALWRMGVERR